MIAIALKMLMRDRAKYFMLVCGLAFCSLLMTQQSSIFCGLMRWTTAPVRNIDAPIWVCDRMMEQANEPIPLRQIEVDRVRSIPGVQWAVPLYLGSLQARLPDGAQQTIQVLGLDTASLTGRPATMIAGCLEDLRLPNAMIIDQATAKKCAQKGFPIKLWSVLEVNDHEAKVVGICHAETSFGGLPYVYTTYDQALEFAPPQRKQLSFVLVQPLAGIGEQTVIERINALNGLKAYDRESLAWKTVLWHISNTGIPVSFGTVVVLGIVVGIIIAGQTFYLFIHDNIRYLAALKAMGASMARLTGMVFAQAATVGCTGYGLGVGLAALFGFTAGNKDDFPFYMPWQIPFFSLGAIICISLFSALLGLNRIRTIETASVFR